MRTLMLALVALAAGPALAETVQVPLPCEADHVDVASAAPTAVIHCKGGGFRVVETPSGRVLRSVAPVELPGMEAQIDSGAVSPDGRAFAVSYFNATLAVVWTDAARPISVVKTDHYVNNLRFDAKARTLFADHRLVDLTGDPHVSGAVSTAFDTLNDVALSVDGRRMAGFAADTSISLWSLPDLKPLARNDAATVEPFTGAYSIDGRTLVVGMADGRILLLDPQTLVERGAASTAPASGVTGLQAIDARTMLIRHRPWIGGDSGYSILDLQTRTTRPLSAQRKVDAVAPHAGRVWFFALDGKRLNAWTP